MALPFTAYRRTSDYWDMTHPHFHTEAEILFPLTDGGTIFIDSTPYPLRRGSLFVMDSAMLHRSFSRDGAEYTRCVLHFPLSSAEQLGLHTLPQLLQQKGCCAQLTEEEFTLCTHMFDRLMQPEDFLAASLQRTAAFAELLALVVKKWDRPAPAISASSDHTVEAVIGYIRTHLAEALTLDRLADRASLSKSSLSHRFKAATGFSVAEYIIHCRIQQARILLSHGCSVQQAGESAGFGDNSHFIRTFRRITGMTPGQFARSTRERT